MTSSIDITVPADHSPATAEIIRNNFVAAANDINDLQANKLSTTGGTLTGELTGTTINANTYLQNGSPLLSSNQTITIGGDATGSGTTSLTLTLATSGVTAGTYGNITVDAKGRLTAARALAQSDISPLLGSAALVATGTSGAKIGLLNTANTYSATQTFSKPIVTSTVSGGNAGATLTLDLSAGNKFEYTVNTDFAIANPTGGTSGQSFTLFLTQDATGNHTLTGVDTNWQFSNGTLPVLPATPSTTSKIDCTVMASGAILADYTAAYSVPTEVQPVPNPTTNPNLLQSGSTLTDTAHWYVVNGATYSGTSLTVTTDPDSRIAQDVSGLTPNTDYTYTAEFTRSAGIRLSYWNGTTSTVSGNLVQNSDGYASFTFNTGPIAVGATVTVQTANCSPAVAGTFTLTREKLEVGATFTGWTTDTTPPTGATLPDKVFGMYWWRWSGPTLAAVQSAQPNVNVIYAFVAQNGSGGAGSVEFSDSTFQSDLAAWHAAGKIALLSIGGAGVSLGLGATGNRTNFLNSVMPIIDAYGFDGIDWDLEAEGSDGSGNDNGDGTRQGIVFCSQQLKAHYGSNFIISLVPQPYKFRGSNTLYMDIARDLGSDCDLIGPQFYDFSGDDTFYKNQIASDISNAISMGIDASKLIIGCAAPGADSSGRASSQAYADAYTAQKTAHPTLRGAFVYHSEADQAAAWQLSDLLGPAINP